MDKKNTENAGEQKTVEETVNTVDYRSAAGKGRDEAKEEPVQIVHSKTEGDTDPTIGSKIGGALTGATAAVSSTVQSARDAISGGNENKKECGAKDQTVVSNTVQSDKDDVSGGDEKTKKGGGASAAVKNTVQSAKVAISGVLGGGGGEDKKKDTSTVGTDDKKESGGK